VSAVLPQATSAPAAESSTAEQIATRCHKGRIPAPALSARDFSMSDTGPETICPPRSLTRGWDLHNESAPLAIESAYPVWQHFSGNFGW
jgi:hypothetical protein